MAKPDTRKRDRAEYFRKYRARRKAEDPSLRAEIDDLRARVATLEARERGRGWVDRQIDSADQVVALRPGDKLLVRDQAVNSPLSNGVHEVGQSFGAPRPAPQQKAKAR